MTIRIRGIYATALTALLSDAGEGTTVVQASDAIDGRFEGEEFPIEPAAASIGTSDDRQGVAVVGDPETVVDALQTLVDVGIDALAWGDPTPQGAIFDGEVRETLGSGAVVALGADDEASDPVHDAVARFPFAATDGSGFLPYGNADDRIEEGDRVRVQVREPAPPWSDDRPLLDTTIRIERSLVTLQRGGISGTGGPHLGDVLPTDPPEGWGVHWDNASEEADLDALDDALEGAVDRAERVDDVLAAAPSGGDHGGGANTIAPGRATAWIWFGRESRFALDEIRRRSTPTMAGHHRTKAGADAASAAVDFVESVCPDAEAAEIGTDDVDFPFDAVTTHFGPAVGDRVAIHHGKPDGRVLTLGRADVDAVDADGSVTLRRELSTSGTYDGLGTRREPGDVATTKVVEGRWWYPTTYRSADGEGRGTYVNVCTPVEVFPQAVRYVDLHVDVVRRPDGTVERLDDAELDAAETRGTLSESLAEKARTVASAVEKAL